MKCPSDGATLVMSERSGIEIDYCPDCRGVWLDRGELDKIVDRAGTQGAAPAPPPQQAPQQAQPPAQPQAPAYPQHVTQSAPAPAYASSYGRPGYKRKRRDNWLSDLFD